MVVCLQMIEAYDCVDHFSFAANETVDFSLIRILSGAILTFCGVHSSWSKAVAIQLRVGLVEGNRLRVRRFVMT